MNRLSPSPSPLGEVESPFLSGWRASATLLVLLLVSALCQIDRILPFILAESIKRDLGLSDTQLGLMTGVAFAVCFSLMALPLARLADRGSPRLVLVACIVVWSAMTGLGGLAASFLFLAISRFGVAFGEAGAVPAGHALIARKIRPESRGMAIGLFSMGIPLGTMIGFAVGGRIGDAFGWRTAFLGAGALGVFIALLAALVPGATPALRQAAANTEPFLQSSLRLLVSPAFRWLFVGAIVLGFASAPFYAFAAPFLIRTHGFTASEVGLSFGLLQGLMGIVGTLLGGRGFDRALRSGKGVASTTSCPFSCRKHNHLHGALHAGRLARHPAVCPGDAVVCIPPSMGLRKRAPRRGPGQTGAGIQPCLDRIESSRSNFRDRSSSA